MALHKLLCGLSLILILEFKGSNAQLSECGKATWNNKILGGQGANPGSWPWQASIHYNSRHFCGGSLINKEWVLSSVLCLRIFNSSYLTVYLGRHNQSGTNPNEVNRTITQVIVHQNYPLFHTAPHEYDIALLKLSSPVSFTSYIRPVCLAASNSTLYAGADNNWVTGWGRDRWNNPNTLQEVKVPIVGNNKCDCIYEQDGYYEITENMLCAGGAKGKGTCQGDGGGPLVSYQHSYWVQSGVMSFAIGCAWRGFPAVYTRVSRFQDWINSHITTDQPGFVRFTSPGPDTDEGFVCHTQPPQPPMTNPPMTDPPMTDPPMTYPLMTKPPMTKPPGPPMTKPPPVKPCESLFCGGPNTVHFSYFTYVSTLVLMLYSMAGFA